MATERVQVVVRLPVDVVARLRQERQETGRSLQAILEEAVRIREAEVWYRRRIEEREAAAAARDAKPDA